jgi:hypothetical protein
MHWPTPAHGSIRRFAVSTRAMSWPSHLTSDTAPSLAVECLNRTRCRSIRTACCKPRSANSGATEGAVVTSAAALRLRRLDRTWEVLAGEHVVRAPIVVNADGAWGDVVAIRAGIPPLALQPRRRTVCLAEVADVDNTWPLVMDIAGRYYFDRSRVVC